MIRILAVGKKHESWVLNGIERYEKRLKAPWNVSWELLPHSRFDVDRARQDESEALLRRIGPDDFVILLDERGKSYDSPAFSALLSDTFTNGKKVVLIIGGAFGVNDALRSRANQVLTISPFVFPHQLVRLVLIEQLYRAQEIATGGKYHHI